MMLSVVWRGRGTGGTISTTIGWPRLISCPQTRRGFRQMRDTEVVIGKPLALWRQQPKSSASR